MSLTHQQQRQLIIDYKRQLNDLYKHNDLMNLLEDINQLPQNVSPEIISIERSPRNKEINVTSLVNYLINHGYFDIYDEITTKNISEFIETLSQQASDESNSINRDDSSKFLPIEMEPQRQVNPLEDLVANTISVVDLLNIYNRYSPTPMTEEELREKTGNDQNLAKSQLLEAILLAARDGYLVRQGGGNFGTKQGMKELEKIVLDLQRDVKRVSKAISPQGAQELVNKHNKSNPKSPWKLDTSDRNKDGIPDVVIENHRGEPMYVNGYTTKRSDWPYVYNYYHELPKRSQRKNYPLSAFKQDMWEPQYVDEGEDYSAYGNVTYTTPQPFANANLSPYAVHEPKRMSSYTRYRKFVLGPYVDSVIQELAQEGKVIPKQYKLQILASAMAKIWELELNRNFYERFNATTKEAQAKIKKNYKGEIDSFVTSLIQNVKTNNAQTITNIKQNLKGALTQVVQELSL